MDLCNELSGKLDEESRSDNTSMPSMEQSVDHAVTEISQQERFSYDELTSKVMKQLKFLKAQQIHTQVVDVIKELKWVHKKLEMQCEDTKDYYYYY